jgi:membrane AbrB-like protein
MPIQTVLVSTAFLILGASGGFLGNLVKLPLPWMLGALLINASMCIFRPKLVPENYAFPLQFRMIFIAIIGVMIGSQVSSDLISQFPLIGMSILGLTAFVPLAFMANIAIFQRLGGYNCTTAVFCGAPGGLMETIAMGEARGCDIRLLSMQQFLRIIVVITLVPVIMSLWIGEPLGSAAGLKIGISNREMTAQGITISLLAALVGLFLGRRLKLPAGQLMGPLVMAALVNLSGLATITLPNSLIIIAQIVIGTSLGTRFSGLNKSMLLRAIGLSFASVSAMMLIGIIICLILSYSKQFPLDLLLISFAPGGLTEMSLIALTLSANPALISLHHLYRIILTVLLLGIIDRRLRATE